MQNFICQACLLDGIVNNVLGLFKFLNNLDTFHFHLNLMYNSKYSAHEKFNLT